MARKRYLSDMSDDQWNEIKELIPPTEPGGRPRDVDIREIFYLNRTGCPWRMLPNDFPPWQTIYTYFRDWRLSGVWKKINDVLRKRLRKQDGRVIQASAGIIDSQSVKTTSISGIRGYDGGKKINGRKRHILVDTLGLFIAVVHAADIQDRDGGLLVFERIQNVLSQLKL